MTELELEQIGKILVDHFYEPCDWLEIDWCSENCGKVDCSFCWTRFLKGKLFNKGIKVKEE